METKPYNGEPEHTHPRFSHTAGRNIKWHNYSAIWQFLKKLCDPAVLLLAIYPGKMKACVLTKHLCTMFIAASDLTIKTGNNSNAH